MNILITGAGLIGCYGAGRLLASGHRVVLFDVFPDHGYIRDIVGNASGLTVASGDVRDLPALIAIMQEHRIDTVVHGAGLIAKRAAEHPYTGFTVNVQGTIHAAEAVRLLKAKRLIFLSSFGGYNWEIPAKAPVTEDFPLGGEGLYGATKAANEHLLGAFADLYGFELIALRPAIVFGRGHFRGGSPGGIMMNNLVAGAARGESVRLMEASVGTNEYVYVKDVAQAIEKACTTATVKERAFNIGSGVLTSAQELIETLRNVVPGARVELVPAVAGEKIIRRSQPLDLSRSRMKLDYQPEYSLEKALADYVQELRAQPAAA